MEPTATMKPNSLTCNLHQPFHTAAAHIGVIALPDIICHHTVMPIRKHNNRLVIVIGVSR